MKSTRDIDSVLDLPVEGRLILAGIEPTRRIFMFDTEFGLFDLPFFGMTHAGYEHPLERAAHHADETADVSTKAARRQIQSQADTASRHAATRIRLQGEPR
jgi:hypothetical protein